MADSIHVRPALERDIASLASIQVESWEVAYRGKLPDAVIDARHHEARTAAWWAILRQPWRRTDPIHQCWIAELHGRPAAFADVGRPREAVELREPLEVMAWYASPWAWRRGTGRALWRVIDAHATRHGCEHVVLWVLADNPRAIAFYQAMGLRLDGVVKDVEMAGTAVPHARMSAAR